MEREGNGGICEFPVGAVVEITAIQGVKLIVKERKMRRVNHGCYYRIDFIS